VSNNLFSRLRKFFKSQDKSTRCRQALGDKASVSEFAKFWERNGEDLLVVSAMLMHEYTAQRSFTKKEFDAYKLAIGDFGKFFVDCSKEHEIESLRKDISSLNDIPDVNVV